MLRDKLKYKKFIKHCSNGIVFKLSNVYRKQLYNNDSLNKDEIRESLVHITRSSNINQNKLLRSLITGKFDKSFKIYLQGEINKIKKIYTKIRYKGLNK